MRGRGVTNRCELARFVSTQGKLLDRACALPRRIKHLRPAQTDLNRTLHEPGRRRAEQNVAPLKSLRPKSAADKRANDTHVLQRQIECIRQDFLELFDPASRVMHE